MPNSSDKLTPRVAPNFAAPQHRPQPLLAFLHFLRSNTEGDPVRMRRALAGLRRYQEAERAPAPALPPVIAERHGACVLDYGGSGPDLLFVPSLINPPTVLDLGERSLLRWLAAQKRRVLLLDWGCPGSERQGLSVAEHVEDILLPLMREFDTPPDLAGYCLGGTMALAAAQLGGARSLTLIAAPWRFSGFGGAERKAMAALWAAHGQASASLGLLPMEVLQLAFWGLDPERTVRKFESLADADAAQLQTFVTLEDWANDGPPLPHHAARELFEDFFAADVTGRGEWPVAGQVVDPAALACPVLNIVSTTDRIVPAASTPAFGERLELARGHVGMVVGSGAEQELWRPLAAWLSRVSPT